MAFTQVAIDYLDFDAALALAEQVAAHVDILEIGTPCIKHNGIGLLKELRQRFPDNRILVDLKTMDAGEYELSPFFATGADICTVLGTADIGTVKGGIKAADAFFTEHVGIHKMLVVDDRDHLRGLVTFSDVDRITAESHSRRKPARDAAFRLVVGAAIAPIRLPNGQLDRDHILTHVGHLVDESIDAIAVSTAHGHTADVGDMVRLLRDAFPSLAIIAGNVTSGAGVAFLAECGATAIKVGQGPGSICTTRIVAGVGIPQLTALYVASCAARARGVQIIADGGITKSGDIVKALTLVDAVILGGLLAGCREAPGEIMEINGKTYKQYRGMGSLTAMKAGSAARYGHDKTDSTRKLTAEGIEALKEISGSVDDVLDSLVGGLQSGMGYLGATTLTALRTKARYIRVSPAGQKEASPHDVIEIKAQAKA